MAERGRGIRWPDGISLSVGPFGAAYYFDPGSPTAPRVTVTGGLGLGTSGTGLHAVFRRRGMTSEDALGYGVTGNVSTILPSVTVNGSTPDQNYIPQLSKTRVSSIEPGIGFPGASGAVTYTATPQQIADFISKYLTPPATGPHDELSPFARTLQSGVGTVGAPIAPPIGYPGLRQQNPLGNEMGDWRSSVGPVDAPKQASPEEASPKIGPDGGLPSSSSFTNGAPPIPFLPVASQRTPRGLPAMLAEIGAFDQSSPDAPPAGGLLGLLQDYWRNNPDAYR